MASKELFSSLPDDVGNVFTISEEGIIRINRGMGQAVLTLAEQQSQGKLFDIDEFGHPKVDRHLHSVE